MPSHIENNKNIEVGPANATDKIMASKREAVIIRLSPDSLEEVETFHSFTPEEVRFFSMSIFNYFFVILKILKIFLYTGICSSKDSIFLWKDKGCPLPKDSIEESGQDVG
jgi:hypothetical protein